MVKTRVRAMLANGVLLGSASALVLKFMSSVLAFVTFALAARQMEPQDFGHLAVIFNAVSFLSVAVVFGQETLISRSWREYCGAGQPGLARGALTFGALVTIVASIVSTVLCVGIWLTFGSPDTVWLPIAAGAYLLAQTLMTFNGRFTLVAAGLLAAEVPREIPWRLAIVAGILLCAALQIGFTATEFFLIGAGVLMLSLLFQVRQVARVFPEAVKRARPEFDIATWRHRSWRMWISSLLDTSSQYLEVIVIAFFLGPAAAAFYFAATRITNVFAMIAAGMTTYATTHISSLFHADAKHELQNVLRSLAIISAVLCAGAFVTVLIAGKLLLSFYGPAYVAIYPALIVLAFGASLTALAGPAPYLLLLTGHERVYPRIVGAGLLLKMALIVVLSHWFGLMGAAVAGSASAAFVAIALVLACRRAIKLDPSFASALWRMELFGGLAEPSPRRVT